MDNQLFLRLGNSNIELIKPETSSSSKKKKSNALSPAVVEQAILEILQNAEEIFDLYQIDAKILDLSVGISPQRISPKKDIESKDLMLQFNSSFHFEYEINCQQKLNTDS